MTLLKGIVEKERQRRWRIVLRVFEASGAEAMPWMAATSQNDPDVIIEITNLVRERVSVYSWYGLGNWFCISDNQVSQSVDGVYSFVEFGKGQIKEIVEGEGRIIISGQPFPVPRSLVKIYAELIKEIESSIPEEDDVG